jgi:quercetin dioxygenase-like cupin family protein
MELNADFTRRAVVHAAALDWISSPTPGVERRMLDRIGGEVARATSIVRYAPDSHFPRHTHGGGEEFLVLEGVFEDEHGEYPAGFYIRNPPTSAHTPGSRKGCTIFVKLWQFDPADRTEVRIDTRKLAFASDPQRAGIAVVTLFENAHEAVTLQRWSPDADLALQSPNGLELLVVDGAFLEGEERFAYQSWLRLPAGSEATVRAGETGCRVWMKSGHLARAQSAPTHER